MASCLTAPSQALEVLFKVITTMKITHLKSKATSCRGQCINTCIKLARERNVRMSRSILRWPNGELYFQWNKIKKMHKKRFAHITLVSCWLSVIRWLPIWNLYLNLMTFIYRARWCGHHHKSSTPPHPQLRRPQLLPRWRQLNRITSTCTWRTPWCTQPAWAPWLALDVHLHTLLSQPW